MSGGEGGRQGAQIRSERHIPLFLSQFQSAVSQGGVVWRVVRRGRVLRGEVENWRGEVTMEAGVARPWPVAVRGGEQGAGVSRGEQGASVSRGEEEGSVSRGEEEGR